MAETKKTTVKKSAPKTAAKKTTVKKAATAKKPAAKKTSPAKKAAPKKTAAKKVAPKKATVKKVATPKVEEKVQTVEAVVEVSSAPTADGVRPTTYAEVSRIHRGALSTLKGSVVVTSSQNGEGASLLAHLMAQKSAENGSRVLLIDLNMRNQSLSNSLAAERKVWGLAQRPVGDHLADLPKEVPGVENLEFMAAPADAESVLYLKDVHRAQAFFHALERQYDHVIVDTTPVGALNRGNADPVLLAAATRRTILVMMAGVTPRARVERTIKQLREAGAKIEGVVVNDRENPSLKRQLLTFVNGLQQMAPGLSDWLRHKILKAEHLD